eukprot:3216168-Amphidinium_carterae.1
MTKTYGDLRHGQPACSFGNCTFVEERFGLSGESERTSCLRVTSSITLSIQSLNLERRPLRANSRQNQHMPWH